MRRWRAAVGLLERCREVTMAGEAEVQREGGYIVVLRDQVQRPRQAQAKVIAIQRESFDLLECLRQVHGGSADFRRRSRASVQRRDRSLASSTLTRSTSRRRAYVAPGLRDVRGPTLLQTSVSDRLSASSGSMRPVLQGVAKQRDERLGTRIDAQCCWRKPTGPLIVQEVRGYELVNQRLRQRQVQARIAAGDGMADAIALSGIEEQHVVRVRHRLVVADMSQRRRRDRETPGASPRRIPPRCDAGTCPGSRHSAPRRCRNRAGG